MLRLQRAVGFDQVGAEPAEGDAGSALACVANFSGSPHHGYRIGLPRGGHWREVLNTDGEGYGGSGVGNYGGVEAVVDVGQGDPGALPACLGLDDQGGRLQRVEGVAGVAVGPVEDPASLSPEERERRAKLLYNPRAIPAPA